MPAFRLAPVALGTLVCAALIGCASVEPRAGAAWRIEPLMRVSHGGDPANGRAYAALGEAYQGEGRWQEAATRWGRLPKIPAGPSMVVRIPEGELELLK